MLNQSLSDTSSEPLPASKQAIQAAGTSLEVSVTTDTPAGGIQQYPVADAVRAAGEAGLIRNQGAKIFLQSLVQLREADLADARQERREARNDVEHYKEAFFKEQTKNAVLIERLSGDIRFKKLQNVLITLGGVFLGAGLQPLFAAFSPVYCVVAVAGLVLLLFGWFYPTGPRKED